MAEYDRLRFGDPGSEAQRRLRRLTDEVADTQDPMYHAQVTLFRHWLDLTEMALRDEGVPPDVARAVLNRIVYGVPNALDARQRITGFEKRVEKAMVDPSVLGRRG